MLIFVCSSCFTSQTVLADQKQPAAEQQKLVYLDLQKYDGDFYYHGTSSLTRELFRQAFLIAARDELGYRTRDVALGDTIPPKDIKGQQIFNVLIKKADRKGHLEVQITQKEGDTEKLVQKRKLKLTKRTPVTELVTFTEELSRTWFKDILQQAGYVPQKRKKSTTAIPSGRHHFFQPKKLNYREQFSRLVDLHHEIAKQGEAPKRLALLAQSYALYGTLTEQYWSLIPQTTKARALLYAERLQQKCPQTAYALSYRAFVRTLVGLDQMALADIQKISDPQVDQKSKPEWLPVIEAYCLHDDDRITPDELSPENDLLFRYLKLLQASYFGTSLEKDSAADAVLNLISDSNRAFYTKPRELDPRPGMRMIARTNVNLMNYALPYIEGQNTLRKLPEFSGTNLQRMIEDRTEIASEFLSMGSNPAEEAEPSYSLLGSSVKELTFVQGWDLISRYRELRGVDADEILDIFLGPLSDHPFKPFLKSFSWNGATTAEAFSELRFVPEQYWTPAIYPIFIRDRILSLQDEPLETFRPDYANSASHVISELAYALDYAVPESEKSKWVSYLRATSPHSPYTTLHEVSYNWEQNKDRIPHLLKRYEDSFLLIYAIGQQYRIRFDYSQAETVYKRMFKKNPSYETIYPLIGLARAQDKHELELKLRLEAVELSDNLMIKAGQHKNIARYYFRRRDYKAALPHAQIAAKTYSSWGLKIEADCHELLGDLNRAFELREKDAIRYQNEFDFHAWCRSRGLEPPQGIQKKIKPLLDYYSKVPLPDDRHLISNQVIFNYLTAVGFYLYLENQPKAALEVMRYASEEYNYVAGTFPAVWAALIADELGLSEVRDECLSKAIKIEFRFRGKTYYVHQLRQILLMKQILTGDSTPQLSSEVIDWYLQEPPNEEMRTNYLYFIGKALLQKKQDKLAIRYLKLAAASPDQHLTVTRLAAFTLLKLKIKQEPLHNNQFDEDTDWMLGLLDKAHAYQYHKFHELELINLNRAVKHFPESSLVFLNRAKLHAAQKHRDLAQQDFAKALELTPQVPDLWLSRGEFYESIGNDQAAIEDYQQTLERDPESYFAHQKLATFLAASRDNKVRNGKQALKHAQQAAKLFPEKNSVNLALIAVAYAELKQFDKAKEFNQNAIKSEKDFRIRRVLQKRQKLYEAKKPFRLRKRS